MAKVPFSKYGISVPTSGVMVPAYNKAGEELPYEVKTYLPFKEKLELVAAILNQSIDEYDYYNPMRVEMFTTLEIVFAYTNLSFTEKQKEDLFKLYDMIVSSGIYNAVIHAIPEQELKMIKASVQDTIKSIYAWKNSARGVLEQLRSDYNNTDMNIEAIAKRLKDPEALELVKSILTKLG